MQQTASSVTRGSRVAQWLGRQPNGFALAKRNTFSCLQWSTRRNGLRTATTTTINRPSSSLCAPSATTSPGLSLLPHASSMLPTGGARSYSTSEYRPPVTEFTEEEEMLRATVAQFAREKLQPKVKEMDAKAELDKDVLKALFEQGLMGIETPTEMGGAGMGFTAACIVIEELAKVDPAISVIVDVQNTLVNTCLRKYASEELKQEWLPRLATDTLGSFCLSEWSCGTDAFALTTKANQDGDHYILNGTKAWITNAKEAGVFVVMATVDPSKGRHGITAFLVERDNPGLIIGKKEDKLGIRASSTCEVILQDCKVHKKNIIGEIGKGWKLAIESLNEGRIGIGAQMLGLAEGAFDYVMQYINQRKAFGKHVSEFQGVQFQVASAAADILAARLLVYNAARLQEAGKPCLLDASVAKLRASELAESVSSLAINLMGGLGFTKECDVEKFFRDSKIGQIYEGTSNIQLQTIAKQLQQKYQP
ncbi:Short/branched chain specific acyl-CoA dehydrogenase, mitochondrial [Balamuthia mandrillaris]